MKKVRKETQIEFRKFTEKNDVIYLALFDEKEQSEGNEKKNQTFPFWNRIFFFVASSC
jgi:hypothetical protein